MAHCPMVNPLMRADLQRKYRCFRFWYEILKYEESEFVMIFSDDQPRSLQIWKKMIRRGINFYFWYKTTSMPLIPLPANYHPAQHDRLLSELRTYVRSLLLVGELGFGSVYNLGTRDVPKMNLLLAYCGMRKEELPLGERAEQFPEGGVGIYVSEESSDHSSASSSTYAALKNHYRYPVYSGPGACVCANTSIEDFVRLNDPFRMESLSSVVDSSSTLLDERGPSSSEEVTSGSESVACIDDVLIGGVAPKMNWLLVNRKIIKEQLFFKKQRYQQYPPEDDDGNGKSPEGSSDHSSTSISSTRAVPENFCLSVCSGVGAGVRVNSDTKNFVRLNDRFRNMEISSSRVDSSNALAESEPSSSGRAGTSGSKSCACFDDVFFKDIFVEQLTGGYSLSKEGISDVQS